MRIVIATLLFSIVSFGQVVHKKKAVLLGSPFEITVIAKDSIEGENIVI